MIDSPQGVATWLDWVHNADFIQNGQKKFAAKKRLKQALPKEDKDSSGLQLGFWLFNPNCPICGKAVVEMGPIVTHLASVSGISG
ncbi:hypothetical protein E2542_SST15676 [Spatholobus suberectus]|nr:hypothetical protein E2542_SST15676 [Spatholobus suberectus]